MADRTDPKETDRGGWARIMFRLGILVVLVVVLAFIWVSRLYLSQRFTEDLQVKGEAQLALYSGRMISEIQRASVVPLLLSQDPTFINDLNTGDFTRSSQRLIQFRDEIGVKSIVLLDKGGRTVATSDRRELGQILRDRDFFLTAARSPVTVFTAEGVNEGAIGFYFSQKLELSGEMLGVVVVEIDLDNLFATWSGSDATIIVTDSEGIVILSTERQFRNQTLEQALQRETVQTAVERALRGTGEFTNTVADAFMRGQPLFQLEAKVPFQGWRMTYLSPFDDVRARVNAVLALEIMAIAILAALGFYILSRRAIRQSFLFQAESRDLRRLNEQLSEEIRQRETAERNLQVAEQSLAQSSKLAALGEMSAAVSHELNQPLAAMRTYLAGAKLLLQRRRPAEAMSSFQRIDDLIERMGAITKQLKSYARKSGDDLVPVDFKDAVTASLSMMSPQLGQGAVQVDMDLPDHPVMVLADQVRLEQVIVNLIRNALDATKGEDAREIRLTLSDNMQMATLAVRDNGHGIQDLENLFEPFFTTKQPGDGIGLGLAISSGIAKDLGGRLFARNIVPKGAEFEFQLPRLENDSIKAAE